MSELKIPIGPQHPLLKEPLSITLSLSGERVVEAKTNIGYVHRGMERLATQRTYMQNVAMMECICGICSHAHTTAYCQAVETLLGAEIPQRAAYIRVLFCELERIHSHLLWLGVLAEAIGFTTIFMYTWRDREMILDIMEELSGGRIAHAVNVIGGVRVDLSAEQRSWLGQRLDDFRPQMDLFEQLVDRDRSFRRRTRDIGLLTREQIRAFGIVGPVARASGVDVDMRRDAPSAAYPELDFRVITGSESDVRARAKVRVEEILESVHICKQVAERLPDGPVTARVPRRVPAGEVIARCEAPRGELFYYVRSDGSDRPTRLKIRTPSLPLLYALEQMLPGLETADIASVIAGSDLCIACADR